MEINKALLPKRIHLVGIGGSGMSAIAHYLLDLNILVSGSDIRHSEIIADLADRGCVIFTSHDSSNLGAANLVVISDAVSPMNPEIAEARLRDIPITKRARFLQQLGDGKSVIHVTGSHGKTTTSAMITTVLKAVGANPAFIVGADLIGLGNKRAAASDGSILVAEACEAFRNLSHYTPDYAVITNIDDDHLEHYGNQDALDAAFIKFASRVSENGTVFVNGDDPGIRRLSHLLPSSAVSFGLAPCNDISASELELQWDGSSFILRAQGCDPVSVYLPIPGRHMVENALGCIAVCLSLDIDAQAMASALSQLGKVSRRWNLHGVFSGIQIIEDFAHHPTELRANQATKQVLCRCNQGV